jgi:hypothetical protein
MNIEPSWVPLRSDPGDLTTVEEAKVSQERLGLITAGTPTAMELLGTS